MKTARPDPNPLWSRPPRGWYAGVLWSILSISVAGAAGVPRNRTCSVGILGGIPLPGSPRPFEVLSFGDVLCHRFRRNYVDYTAYWPKPDEPLASAAAGNSAYI